MQIALIFVCLTALSLRVGIALALPTYYHGDEIYQSAEQGHRLVYGNGLIPWEFEQGVRSWLLPGFIGGTMWVGDALFRFDGGYLLAPELVLILSSLAPVICSFLWAYHERSNVTAGVLAGLGCALWFELIYFAPKSLSEVIAAHLLVIGAFVGRSEVVAAPSSRAFLSGIFHTA